MPDPVELFPEIANIYDFPSVHADMVFDVTRVRAYRDAIKSTVNSGDVVADVGAGTGLLSFLCLQAGARRVHAIERTNVISWARELAYRNGYLDQMVFHNADARETELAEKVDVIVSELMGHAAFEEGMAETISIAKDRFLTPSGRTIPASVVLRAALANEVDLYEHYIDAWEHFDGIDYSLMREKAIDGIYLLNVNPDHLCSDDQIILDDNFTEAPRNLEKSITFRSSRAGQVNGLVLWFDARLTSSVYLSSSPGSHTHWMQCFAPLHRPITVCSDEEIAVRISMRFRNNIGDPFLFRVSYER